MTLESFNTSGVRQFKNRLRSTAAHIMCAQELKVRGQDADELVAWAARQGLTMALEQVFVLHRGMSSGLAVLAKHPLGLRRQMSYAIMKGKHRLSEPSKSRLIGVLVDVSG